MLPFLLLLATCFCPTLSSAGVPIFSLMDRLAERVREDAAAAAAVLPVLFPVIVDLADSDLDGAIGEEDLVQAYGVLQPYWSEVLNESLVEQEVWASLDADGNGTLEAEELGKVMLSPEADLFRPALSYLFARRLDVAPRDGFMNGAELRTLMKGKLRALMKIRKIIAFREKASDDVRFKTAAKVLSVGGPKTKETMETVSEAVETSRTLEPLSVDEVFPTPSTPASTTPKA